MYTTTLHYDLARAKIILGFFDYKLQNANWNAKQGDFFKHIKKKTQKIIICVDFLTWLIKILSQIPL